MIPRSVIQQAFPNQPRMQAAVEGLFADAEDALSRLDTALTSISALSGGATDLLAQIGGKQPKNDTLDAISLIGADPGVLEQIQAGIFAVRPIDAEDTASLLTRQLADTRYLGGAHVAASATKLATARTISITGDGTWTVTFDGSANVSAGLVLATVNTNTGTFGGATTSAQISVNGKGLITGVSAVTITPAFSSITGKPTTLAGYGIADAQGLNANLTAIAGLTTAADKMIYWTGAGAAALVSIPAAARTALATLSGTNTGDQTITLTGDATGSGTGSFAVTVGKVNGVSLAALATGILKNTTGTGAPSIAVAADFPTLNQNTTGSAATLTTARNIDGQAFNGSTDITVIAPGTHAATSKATPVDADELPLVDSAASNVLKKLTWANLKATLKTYLDTLYQPVAAALTSWAAVVRASGFDTFVATPTSANLRALLTDETGTGAAVFAASPTFTGTITASALNTSGGIKDTGTVATRIENTGAAVPTGATGLGIEMAGNQSGVAVFYALNRTSGAYGPLTITGAPLKLQVNGGLPANFASDAAAATGGVGVGELYRNGSILMVRTA